MINSKKRAIFFLFTTLILLVSLSAFNAADTNDSNSIESNANTMVKEVKEVKKVEKIVENKTIKKSVDVTQNVTDYNTLKDAWNNIQENGEENKTYTINLNKGTYLFTQPLENKINSTNLTITLNGEDKTNTILDGQNTSTNIIKIKNTSTQIINLNNLTIQNYFNNDKTGVAYETGAVSIQSGSIDNCIFKNNIQKNVRLRGGGAVVAGNLTCNNSYFTGNYGQMGSVYTYGPIFIYNSNFTNNSGRLGLCYFEGNLTVDGCNFINNTDVSNLLYKGANSNLVCNNSGFIQNNVYSIHTAAYAKTASGVFDNCLFLNNIYSRTGEPSKIFALVNGNFTLNNSYIDGYTNPSYSGMVNGTMDNLISVRVNKQSQGHIFSQLEKNLTIQALKFGIDDDYNVTSFAGGYEINITSDKDYMKSITLSPANNYTTYFDLSNLPDNFETFNIYANGLKIATIENTKTEVKFNPVSTKTGSTVTFNATFTNDKELLSSGKVVFKINHKTIGSTRIKFGKATYTYNIPIYTAKKYNLTVKYGGNEKIPGVEKTTTLTLQKINTKTDISTKTENNTLTIEVQTKDENNKTTINTNSKVAIKINGKTVTKTAMKDGKTTYTYKITKGQNNKNITITAIYGENKIYQTSTSQKTVKLEYKSPVKTVKKATSNTYYVSNTGSDTNDGTQTSPFKTIQHAINMVNTTRVPTTIYLTEGVYKGAGNTNLTVPGDLNINFIGINNAVIDGEVNYTYNTDDGYYWLSSKIWEPYRNGTGNWAMNITQGTGLITINNMTIQNCWSIGGSSNKLCKIATVDNYGNLRVDNVSFIYNHCGVGAGIKNHEEATLVVNNSLFEKNRKADSTGNYGAGIYNNGTATIINSIFRDNYARWGTLTNDKIMTIINCTIRDNIGYDGGSTYKTGTGITSNSEGTDFYGSATGGVGVTTVIDGCTFINNDQMDIYSLKSDINITNNLFNLSTGIRVIDGSDEVKFNVSIINNTITSPVSSTIDSSLSGTNAKIQPLQLSGKYNFLIESNNITNITGTGSKALTLTSDNNTIKNNYFERMMDVNGNSNTITGNNITTKDIYAINLGTYQNNNITGNYLEAGFSGNAAMNYTSPTNIIKDNLPVVTMVNLDDDNFLKFFDEDGNLRDDFQTIEQFQITGALNYREITVNKNLSFTQADNKITSNNVKITVNNGKIEVNGLIIENTEKQPIFILNTDDNKIKSTKIKTDNTYTIEINGKTNNEITENYLMADILVGDESVKTNTTGNKISQNTPTYKNYVLSEETYNTYFNNTTGELKIETDKEIHILVNGTIKNKNIILNNNKTITIINYWNAQLVNTTIKTQDNTTLNMSYISINNTNRKPAIELNSPLRNTILYSNITTDKISIIIRNATGLDIRYNNISAINEEENTTAIQITDTIAKQFIPNSGSGNLRIQYNNITTKGTATSVNRETGRVGTNGIEAVNTTGLCIRDNTITTQATKANGENDTIYGINLVNLEKYDIFTWISDSDINTYGNSYACGINLINQTIYTYDLNIKTEAQKQATGVQATGTSSYGSPYYSHGMGSIKFISDSPAYGLIITDCQNLQPNGHDFILPDNSVGVRINGSNNITLNESTFTINNNSKAVEVINSQKIYINYNNITSYSNITPIQLNGTKYTKVTNNTIDTISKYAVSINENSRSNSVTDNLLYAGEFADKAVEKLNQTNRVFDNRPVKPDTSFYLNDKTYSQYFDENGTLKDEVPDGIKLEVTSTLHNKILNITKPIDIQINKMRFENCTIIVNADNVNISIEKLIGENSKLIVNSDNNNIYIEQIEMNNTRSMNITPVEIKGNNNNITVYDYTAESSYDLNSNITVMTVSGNKNNITLHTFQISYQSRVNNMTGVLFNNADNNSLYVYYINPKANYAECIILNNSNNNSLYLSQVSGNADEFVGLRLTNSSNNTITGRNIGTGNTNKTTALIIENNSNNNRMEYLYLTGYSENYENSPVIINNSHNNTMIDSTLEYTKWKGYAIAINEGTGNVIEYNKINTATLEADKAVFQENFNETVKNTVKYNYQSRLTNMGGNITLPENIKVFDTITITANIGEQNGTSSWNIKYIPTNLGTVTFFVNGVEIETLDVVNGTATINYTVTTTDKLLVKIIYKDPTLKNSPFINNTTVEVQKLDTKILLPDVTNNGVQSTITAIVLDENGKIITNGKVAFKLNGKTLGVVKITNGIAKYTFNTDTYALKNYTITAVYSGDDINSKNTENATLTLTKTEPTIKIETEKVKRTNKTTIKAKIVTSDNKTITKPTKVAIKLNGKTIKTTKINNGTINVDLDLTGYKDTQYTLTIVAGETKYYSKTSTTGELEII